MVEPNEQSSIVEDQAPGSEKVTAARDARLVRPVAVMVVAALLFVAGGALLTFVLSLITRMVASGDLPPEAVGDRNARFIEGVGSACLLPVVIGLIVTGVGLWQLRRWALIVASIMAGLVLLWGLLVALAGSYPGLVLVVGGAVILFVLNQQKVRAQFR